MKTRKTEKKLWSKPEVKVLNIKRDTFGGSYGGEEAAGKGLKIGRR